MMGSNSYFIVIFFHRHLFNDASNVIFILFGVRKLYTCKTMIIHIIGDSKFGEWLRKLEIERRAANNKTRVKQEN